MRTFLINFFVINPNNSITSINIQMKSENFPNSPSITSTIKDALQKQNYKYNGDPMWTGITELVGRDLESFNSILK